ncbi:DUF4214 domain-containing protein [uncultured Ramlibacter sp.]|uniref:DUF4214 domain-containing protein n=1 Tax=uncultured Ramlibacter sp. TaxID=260755 RepID=UPI0026372F6D|nr:DUF4214 domain-containing protein [uncultured Ramlibacter sp.]
MAETPVLEGHSGSAYRMYQAAFDRAPDSAGLNYYIEKLSTRQMTLKSMAIGFYNSPEFKSRYGDVGPQTFIDLLYRNVLGRDGETAGRFFHMSNIANGRTDVYDTLVSFSESPENIARVSASLGTGTAPGTGTLATCPVATDSKMARPYSNWLFVQSDKALQVRYGILKEYSDGTADVCLQYQVNKADSIHCTSASCDGYILETNVLEVPSNSSRHYWFTRAFDGPYTETFLKRRLKFSDGSELRWDQSKGIVLLESGVATGGVWSTLCVDNKLTSGSTRCTYYRPDMSKTVSINGS